MNACIGDMLLKGCKMKLKGSIRPLKELKNLYVAESRGFREP